MARRMPGGRGAPGCGGLACCCCGCCCCCFVASAAGNAPPLLRASSSEGGATSGGVTVTAGRASCARGRGARHTARAAPREDRAPRRATSAHVRRRRRASVSGRAARRLAPGTPPRLRVWLSPLHTAIRGPPARPSREMRGDLAPAQSRPGAGPPSQLPLAGGFKRKNHKKPRISHLGPRRCCPGRPVVPRPVARVAGAPRSLQPRHGRALWQESPTGRPAAGATRPASALP
jgi:hypothetical protein